MSAYMDLSAVDLAGCLDLGAADGTTSGSWSMVSEAISAYGTRFPEVSGPYYAFDTARVDALHEHPGAAEKLAGAARDLATALRPLGDLVLPRCGRPGAYGTCTAVLEDDGTCRSSSHDDEQEHVCPEPGERHDDGLEATR